MNSYEIIRSKRKTLSIQITRDARIIVRAPMRVPQKQIEQFVASHESWIKKHLPEITRELERKSEFNFSDGQTLYFLGEKRIICTNHYIIGVQVNDKFMLISDKIAFESRNKAIVRFLQTEAVNHIKARVDYFAPMLEASPEAVTITSARTRWGSCSGKNRLSFSFRLVCLPPRLIDYVVVHELSHILEHNHSAGFYAHIERILPDYRQQIKELKAFQKLLTF